CVKASIGFDVW
nr:immunoglobulin heavy chain junction region [Macaca mulatta]